MCHLPLCGKKKREKKNQGFSPFSSSYLCAHRSPTMKGGKSKTDGKPCLSEHQHKYKYKYRTFEMPKDSSSPWRQSPSNHYSSKPFSSPVSLPLPRLSLSSPLCLFASVPSSQESSRLSTPDSYCTSLTSSKPSDVISCDWLEASLFSSPRHFSAPATTKTLLICARNLCLWC